MQIDQIKPGDLVTWNEARATAIFRVVKIDGNMALIRRAARVEYENGNHCKALIENLEHACV